MNRYCYTIAGLVTVTGDRQFTSRRSAHRAAPRYAAKLVLSATCLCLGVANSAVLAGAPQSAALKDVPIGATLQDATLQGLNGPSLTLSAFRGRPLIINVWASWCGPCKEEMASLERLAWRSESRYFAVIGISTDDDAQRARDLLKKANATISHFMDTGLQMETMLGASRLPLTVLIDGNGKVLEKIYGARQWDSPDSVQLIDAVFDHAAAASRPSR